MKHPEISLAAVREYVVELQEQGSLRAVAAEIPLNHSTLHNFVSGAEPHPRVRRKLVEWYARHTGGQGLKTANAAETLTDLVGLLPPEGQSRARSDFIATMERTFRDSGSDVPGWVGALRGGR